MAVINQAVKRRYPIKIKPQMLRELQVQYEVTTHFQKEGDSISYLDQIICGDSKELLKKLPSNFIHLIITSPPYFGCRIYGNETLGREESPLDYVNNLLKFTTELKRVLHKEGSFYLNIGDVYFGTKGFIRNKGRYARKTDIHYKDHKIVKPDGKYLQYKQLLMLPERVAIGMQEQGWILRNKIIWEKPNPVPSYSPDRRYPVSLIKPLILTTSRENDIVLDSFIGSGTTAVTCVETGRNCSIYWSNN